jgi:uncharacterized protein (DUF1800 family)
MLSKYLLCAALIASVSLSAAATPPDAAAGLRREDLQWLNRITYGADTAIIERFRTLGRQRFLDEQLAGRDDDLPAAAQTRIAAMDIAKVPASKLLADEIAARRNLKAEGADDAAKIDARKARNAIGNDYLNEAVTRHLLRAVYSPAQLKEQMDWFWLNHFSVFARKGAVRWLVADYDERAIRPHALGKFRDLVLATLTHPAMLQYLDNVQNTASHINENYARELMELHTLGVDAGYTQHDVQELARVLTGLGVARQDLPHRANVVSDGLYAFYPARHDSGDKTLLGHTIRGDGFAEIEQAVDLLVRQPACAHFVSRKLAQYFVADEPPGTLVDAMARTFQRSDGDIAAVLRTLFESREFAASLGKKFKDPMHFVVSSLRLACDGGVLRNEQPLLNWLAAQSELPFAHQSPDGYPLTEAGWASSGQLTRGFVIARAIGSNYANVLDCVANPSGNTPKLDTAAASQNLLAYLSDNSRTSLDHAATPREWNALLLASPEWNYH